MYDSKLAHCSQKHNIFSVFPSVTNDVQAVRCSRKKNKMSVGYFLSVLKNGQILLSKCCVFGVLLSRTYLEMHVLCVIRGGRRRLILLFCPREHEATKERQNAKKRGQKANAPSTKKNENLYFFLPLPHNKSRVSAP
jgi:hypothetical protein